MDEDNSTAKDYVSIVIDGSTTRRCSEGFLLLLLLFLLPPFPSLSLLLSFFFSINEELTF